MNKRITTLLLLIIGLMGRLYAQDLQTSFLVDFGLESATTSSPDENNNTWNNMTAVNAGNSITLEAIDGVTSSVGLEITKSFGGNNAGGLTTPSLDLLPQVGLATVTSDYFYKSGFNPGEFKLTGLNQDSGYKIKIFAARITEATRITQYTVSGLTTFQGTLQTSGTDIGAEGVDGNNNTFYEPSFYVNPDENGEISIEVISTESGFSYISAMVLEEYTNIPKVNVTAFSFDLQDMLSPQGPQQAAITIEPANASVRTATWESSDETVAFVDENGIVYPVGNGEVTITGTSNDPSVSFTQEKTITVANQINELYIDGVEDLSMEEDRKFNYSNHIDGYLSNIFYAYLSLEAGQEFDLYTINDEGNKISYGVDDINGDLVKEGTPITIAETATYSIKADFNTSKITLEKIYDWKLVGTQTPGSWGSSDGPELEHQGGAIWSSTVTLLRDENENYNAMLLRLNGEGGHKLFGTLEANLSKLSYKNEEDKFGGVKSFALADGEYFFTLDLENYTYSIEATTFDERGITFCGSSVAQGWGSVDGHSGYAWMYNNQLQERFENGLGEQWGYKNVSIGGDNTIKVQNRYNIYVPTSGNKYLVYGLSLANEGIMSGGQPIFDQFRDNLLGLIERAREDGLVPVVMNNYANGSYTPEHYEYIKQMNLLIHQWDVPSSNMLGALDDGFGQFINGENGLGDYESDPAHPNDAGHAEFFHSMVPSLFDALDMNKPQPVRGEGEGFTGDAAKSFRNFTFTPDGEVHSFTNTVYVKTDGSGKVFSILVGENEGNVTITEEGKVTYTSPSGTVLMGETVINDNTWHAITLTHYYAREATLLYVDKMEEGVLQEQIITTSVQLHNNIDADNFAVKDWFFYRAGMNDVEINGIVDGLMLKSSLELYVPFSNEFDADAFMANKAQSTVEITKETEKLSQEIQFGELESKTYGDEIFELNSSSSSMLSITYASSNEEIASISNSTVTIHKAGEVTITASQNGDMHYLSAIEVSRILNIEKAVLNASLNNQTMEYGEIVPSFEIQIEGFIGEDTKENIAELPTVVLDVNSKSNVGIYNVMLSGGSAENYTFESTGATLEVEPATLSVSAKDASMIYGDELPSFELMYEGFKNEENATSLLVSPTVQTEATTLSDVGEYSITVESGEALNYNLEYTSGTLSILKADQTLSAFEIPDTLFINEEYTLSISASSSLEVTYEVSDPSLINLKENTLQPLQTGKVTITAMQVEAVNYNDVTISKEVVIAEKEEDVTSIALEKELIQLYPNPVVNTFSLSIQPDHLQILDLSGHQLYSSSRPQKNYDISNFSNGIYLIIIQKGENIYSKKLIKK